MKTTLRKQLQQEKNIKLSNQLLLKDATLWQMTKQYYRNHKEGCDLVTCAWTALVFGIVIGTRV